MSKLSLAGAWKLRGEFMDVTAERYNEVLRKMDAAPVRATLPAFLKLEDLSEEERAEFFKEPNPHFHVMTDKSNHAFPSKYGFIPMTVPGDVVDVQIRSKRRRPHRKRHRRRTFFEGKHKEKPVDQGSFLVARPRF